MNIHSVRSRAKAAAVLAAATATMTVGSLASSIPKASADPAFVSSYVGVGSDTTQDVMNAMSGAAPYPGTPSSSGTVYYIPLHSSSGSGNKTVSSFDAIPQGGSASAPGCITTKLGGSSYDRPNGSSNGIHALSRAINGSLWQASTGSCTGAGASVSGQIDFARSSRGPTTVGCATAPCLTYLPFAGDAVSFSFYDHHAGTVADPHTANNLTSAELTSLYSSTTGQIPHGSDIVKACLTQSGSGTTKFWEKAIGVTDAQAVAAATASGCYSTSAPLEENGADSFYNSFASTLPAGTDAVIDFSSAQWISQANGVSLDRSGVARAAGVDLGSIDGIAPYTGTAPNEAPNTAFYSSTQYGRDVYNVVPTTKIGAFGDAGLKSLFLSIYPPPPAQPTLSAICTTGPGSPQATAAKFGFGPSTQACGSNTLQGVLEP